MQSWIFNERVFQIEHKFKKTEDATKFAIYLDLHVKTDNKGRLATYNEAKHKTSKKLR